MLSTPVVILLIFTIITSHFHRALCGDTYFTVDVAIHHQPACPSANNESTCTLQMAFDSCPVYNNQDFLCYITIAPEVAASDVIYMNTSYLTDDTALCITNVYKRIVIEGNGAVIAPTRPNYIRFFYTWYGTYFDVRNVTLKGFGRRDRSGGVFDANWGAVIKLSHVTTVDSVGYFGGVLHVVDGSTMEVKDSIFINSFGAIDGGTVNGYNLNGVSFSNVIIQNSYENALGGAIFLLQCSNIHLTSLQIINSTARRDGGALHFSSTNNVYLNDIIIQNSTSVQATGGGIYIYQTNNFHATNIQCDNTIAQGSNGGCIYAESGSNFEFSNISVTNTIAAGSGGAMYFNNLQSANVDLLTCNKLKSGNYGGCLTIYNSNSIQVSNVGSTNTEALYGGSIALVNTNNILLEDINVQQASGSRDGGCIYGSVAGITRLKSISLSQCISRGSGGGIFFKDGTQTTFNNVSIVQVSAESSGGGIYVENIPSVELRNVDASQCHANRGSGGGLAIVKATTSILLLSTQFNNNQADQYGGGIYISSSSNANIFMMDAWSYENRATLEFSSSSTKYVTGMNNPKMVVYFDASTKFWNDKAAYGSTGSGSSSLVLLCGAMNWTFNSETALPGVDAPALYIPCFDDVSAVFEKADGIDTISYVKLFVMPIQTNTTTTGTIVSDNSARNNGGGIYIGSLGSTNIISNGFVNSNIATNGSGAGIFVQHSDITTPGLLLLSNRVTNNNAFRNGGGLCFSAAKSAFVDLEYIHIKNNHAGINGGGMYCGNILSSNGSSQGWSDVTIVSNSADQSGGGLYLKSMNQLIISSLMVTDNTAKTGDGGGIVLSRTANSIQTVNNITIARNTAHKGCGGGFAIIAEDNAFQSMEGITIANNTAMNGGGVCIQSSAYLEFAGEVILTENMAHHAGGAWLMLFSDWWLSTSASCVFNRNRARIGSAMFLHGVNASSAVDLGNITFRENVANESTTIVWVYDPALMTSLPSVLEQDANPNAFWIDNVEAFGHRRSTQVTTLQSPQTYVVEVYNKRLSSFIELQLLDHYGQYVAQSHSAHVSLKMNSAHCRSNVRPAITGVSTMSVGMPVLNGVALVSDLKAYCYPGGSISLNAQTSLNSVVKDIPSVSTGYTISNQTTLMFRTCRMGEVIQNDQCFVCPNTTYSLASHGNNSCISCTGTEGIRSCGGRYIELKPGYWRRHDTSHNVFPCVLGEVSCPGGFHTGDDACALGYAGPLCATCAAGYFMSNSECQLCESKAFSPVRVAAFVALVVVIIGVLVIYYFYQRSVALLSDKTQSSASHVAAKADGVNVSVEGEQQIDSENNIGLAIPQDESTLKPGELGKVAVPAEKTNTINSTVATVGSFIKLFQWIQDEGSRFMGRLKIIVATYQVVIATADVFDISLPVNYKAFIRLFSFVNLNAVSFLPLTCWYTFNFIDQLLVTTLAPIFLVMFLGIGFVLEYFTIIRVIADSLEAKKRYRDMESRYLNYFFYLTYLVLPSVTTTIFKLFVCKNIDPNNEDNDPYDSFLTADVRISCTSPYYKSWIWYGILMIIVYPIGINVFYFCCLYAYKDTIDTMPETDEDKAIMINKKNDDAMYKNFESGTSSVEQSTGLVITDQDELNKARVESMSFLWKAYKRRFLYWELVESSRRILLTAVLSICSTGSSDQYVLGILLAFIFIKIYAYYKPYADDGDFLLADMGQNQIFVTYFGALVISKTLLRKPFMDAIGSLLIFFNLGVLFVGFYFEIEEFSTKSTGRLADACKLIVKVVRFLLRNGETSKKTTVSAQAGDPVVITSAQTALESNNISQSSSSRKGRRLIDFLPTRPYFSSAKVYTKEIVVSHVSSKTEDVQS